MSVNVYLNITLVIKVPRNSDNLQINGFKGVFRTSQNFLLLLTRLNGNSMNKMDD